MPLLRALLQSLTRQLPPGGSLSGATPRGWSRIAGGQRKESVGAVSDRPCEAASISRIAGEQCSPLQWKGNVGASPRGGRGFYKPPSEREGDRDSGGGSLRV